MSDPTRYHRRSGDDRGRKRRSAGRGKPSWSIWSAPRELFVRKSAQAAPVQSLTSRLRTVMICRNSGPTDTCSTLVIRRLPGRFGTQRPLPGSVSLVFAAGIRV